MYSINGIVSYQHNNDKFELCEKIIVIIMFVIFIVIILLSPGDSLSVGRKFSRFLWKKTCVTTTCMSTGVEKSIPTHFLLSFYRTQSPISH